MKFTNIKQYPSQISSAFKRFPVAMFFALVWFILVIVEYHAKVSDFWSRLFHIYPFLGLVLSVTLELVREKRGSLKLLPNILSHLILASVVIWLLYNEKNQTSNQFFITFTLLSSIICASQFLVPFFRKKDDIPLWSFAGKCIKAFLFSGIITAVLIVTMSLLILGIRTLFDLKFVDDTMFIYAGALCVCIVGPMLFLAGCPYIQEESRTPPPLTKLVSGTVHFVFTPVFALYLLVLYIYLLKIVVTWTLPHGMVSYLVSISMAIALGICGFVFPATYQEEKKFDKVFLKLTPILMTPLLILMGIGIIRRFNDYGMTVSRIQLLALFIWFIAVTAILLIKKIQRKIWWTIASFCGIFLVVTIGPLNAYSVTESYLTNQLEKDLAQAGYSSFPLNKETAKDAENKMLSGDTSMYMRYIDRKRYLRREFGEKALAPYFSFENPEENLMEVTSSAIERRESPAVVESRRSPAIEKRIFYMKAALYSLEQVEIPKDRKHLQLVSLSSKNQPTCRINNDSIFVTYAASDSITLDIALAKDELQSGSKEDAPEHLKENWDKPLVTHEFKKENYTFMLTGYQFNIKGDKFGTCYIYGILFLN